MDMIKISVKVDVDRALRRLSQLRDDVQNKAIVAALNKTGDKARVEMKRQIAAEYAIKVSDANAQLQVSRASGSGNKMWVTLSAFGRRRGHRSRNVMMFSARQTSQGVVVQIKRNGGKKLIKGAFIGNQGRTVFIRTSDKRLPIKAVETIDVPQMFNSKKINEAVRAKVMAEFPIELQRAIRMYLPRK